MYYLKATTIQGAKVMEGGYIAVKNGEVCVCADIEQADKYNTKAEAHKAQALLYHNGQGSIKVAVGKI